MTLEELRAHFQKNIDAPFVTLKLPARKTTGKVRLFKKLGGPTGDILSDNERGYMLVAFNPKEVIEFMNKKGM